MTETNALRLLEQLSREIISGRIAAGTRLDEKPSPRPTICRARRCARP
ncbi:hypothetical protein QWZ10_03795 [Paracoccus cavernae]|uniref:GntR family transcriptional regulator n=1 Tax=Paracoccus cavernae TaxID=1571207 RepID=A0ABT8D2X8_9RHOB|nr:hypothetical protein [Paracoccus cavernae]